MLSFVVLKGSIKNFRASTLVWHWRLVLSPVFIRELSQCSWRHAEAHNWTNPENNDGRMLGPKWHSCIITSKARGTLQKRNQKGCKIQRMAGCEPKRHLQAMIQTLPSCTPWGRTRPGPSKFHPGSGRGSWGTTPSWGPDHWELTVLLSSAEQLGDCTCSSGHQGKKIN